MPPPRRIKGVGPLRKHELRYHKALRQSALRPWFDDIASGVIRTQGLANQLGALHSAGTWAAQGAHDPAIATQARLVNESHRARFIDSFKSGLAIDISGVLDEERIRLGLLQWQGTNATLIKDAAGKAFDRLDERIKATYFQAPGDRQAMAKMLQDEYGIQNRRLKLIARDQTSKLGGRLTELRQTNLNIKKYIWDSSGDQRVRPSHRDYDQQTFTWEIGSPEGHPGTPVNCRCVAIPVIPRFETRTDVTAQAPEEWKMSAKTTPSPKALEAKVDKLGVRDLGKNTMAKGDLSLKDYAKFRWGEQRAQVVDGGTFETMKGASNIRWRGLAQQAQVESNLNGQWFGSGVLGNGNYFGPADTAISYAGRSGWMYRAKIHPNARIISDKAAQKLADDAVAAARKAGKKGAESFSSDPGRAAARAGYDVIFRESSDFHVVLNQRAVVVDARSLPKGEWGKRFKDFQKNPAKQVANAEKEYDIALEAFLKNPNLKAAQDRVQAAGEAKNIIYGSGENAQVDIQAFFRNLILELGGG